jgi:hypothetical protein
VHLHLAAAAQVAAQLQHQLLCLSVLMWQQWRLHLLLPLLRRHCAGQQLWLQLQL